MRRPHVGVRATSSPPTWGSTKCLLPTRETTSGEEHPLRWRGGDHLPTCDLRMLPVQLLRTQLTALCPVDSPFQELIFSLIQEARLDFTRSDLDEIRWSMASASPHVRDPWRNASPPRGGPCNEFAPHVGVHEMPSPHARNYLWRRTPASLARRRPPADL